MKNLFLIILAMFFVASCASDPTQELDYYTKIAAATGIEASPTVIRASGYGVAIDDASLTPMQIKLMAMRAAKIDAYRNIAERIYGTKISGGTSLANLAAKDDKVKAYVNSIVKGAKLVANYELGNGGYEAVLEVTLKPVLKRCLTNEGVIADSHCIGVLNSSDSNNDFSNYDDSDSSSSQKSAKSGGRYQVN